MAIKSNNGYIELSGRDIDDTDALDKILLLCETFGTEAVLVWISRGKAANAIPNQTTDSKVDSLYEWWTKTSQADCEQVAPKAIEYSSVDLTTIGAALPGVAADDQVRTESGIAFYLLGKAARLTGAYGEGRTPSDDTWHDAVVYGMMGRHVRDFGHWGAKR